MQQPLIGSQAPIFFCEKKFIAQIELSVQFNKHLMKVIPFIEIPADLSVLYCAMCVVLTTAKVYKF